MRSNILSKLIFASCVWYSDRAYYIQPLLRATYSSMIAASCRLCYVASWRRPCWNRLFFGQFSTLSNPNQTRSENIPDTRYPILVHVYSSINMNSTAVAVQYGSRSKALVCYHKYYFVLNRAKWPPYWGKTPCAFHVMSAISQSRLAILTALYRDTTMYFNRLLIAFTRGGGLGVVGASD